jgi:hypothetical protein
MNQKKIAEQATRNEALNWPASQTQHQEHFEEEIAM